MCIYIKIKNKDMYLYKIYKSFYFHMSIYLCTFIYLYIFIHLYIYFVYIYLAGYIFSYFTIGKNHHTHTVYKHLKAR